ncbi:hypothetical protein QE152_g34903 [Popillia japonica]|uniref:Uncharacterized protein n=1 Tax=Popillia japonica TaxID=7064 RepID=A0AAW1ISH5_POPJA
MDKIGADIIDITDGIDDSMGNCKNILDIIGDDNFFDIIDITDGIDDSMGNCKNILDIIGDDNFFKWADQIKS